MDYILITIVTLSVTTLIVYKIAQLLKLQLKIKPLVLCAVCALFLSLVLPRIVVGFAGLMGTLVLLAVFAIIFAYFVAYYDEKRLLTESNSTASTAFTGLDEVAHEGYQDLDCPTQLLPAAASVRIETDVLVRETPNDQELILAPVPRAIIEVEPEIDLEPDEPFTIESYTELSFELSSMLRDCNLESIGAEVIQFDTSASEIAAAATSFSEETDYSDMVNPVADLKLDEMVTIVEEEDQAQTLSEMPFSLEDSLSNVEVSETVSGSFQKDENGDEAMNEMAKEVPTVVFGTDNLDELLDYAFEQKEEHNDVQALAAFEQILKLYPDSDAAPYIVIEIGNILKNKGAYDEAIKAFSEGKMLPSSRRKVEFEQEFINTIAYLRIIKNTLVHRRLGLIPFSNIPESVMNEIDAEFREWRNLA